MADGHGASVCIKEMAEMRDKRMNDRGSSGVSEPVVRLHEQAPGTENQCGRTGADTPSKVSNKPRNTIKD